MSHPSDAVCPACKVMVYEHQAGECLDLLVAQVMGDEVLYFPRSGTPPGSTISIGQTSPTDLAACVARCNGLNADDPDRRYVPAPLVRPYSSDKRLVFDVLDRIEGDLVSSMAVAMNMVEEPAAAEPRKLVEVNKAARKWWVKIYYGDRGSSIMPVIDASAALAVSRAVVIADYALKLEAGEGEAVIR